MASTPTWAARASGVLFAILVISGHAGAQEPVVEGPRRTETGEAPGDPGARRENIGNIRPTSNAERRDASPVATNGEDEVRSHREDDARRRVVKCSGPCTTGSQGRTDVVTLPNGDRITGEVVRLDRGRLEFKTDDAGTLYLEWDKVATVQATRAVEVVTGDGRRILGSLGPAASRTLAVVGDAETVSVDMTEVTIIRQIGSSFWRKLDGSFDAGYSYTRSSGVAQLNVNSDTYFRTPAARARLTLSLTQTRKDDDSEPDDRGSLEASYLRYPWRRWFITGAGRFETNKSLGLELRSQVGAAFGPRLVNSNRGQVELGAGVVVNNEQGVDVDTTQNVEALITLRSSFYTYDRPRTNLDLSVVYYPGLSDWGRRRLQLDAGAKRELWKDFFVACTLFNTYDSRPPNPSADTNDVGVVASVGWTY